MVNADFAYLLYGGVNWYANSSFTTFAQIYSPVCTNLHHHHHHHHHPFFRPVHVKRILSDPFSFFMCSLNLVLVLFDAKSPGFLVFWG